MEKNLIEIKKKRTSKFFPKISLVTISIPNSLESKVFHSLEASEIFIAFLWRVNWTWGGRLKRDSSIGLYHALLLHPNKHSCYRNYIPDLLPFTAQHQHALGTARSINSFLGLKTMHRRPRMAFRDLSLSSHNFQIHSSHSVFAFVCYIRIIHPFCW